MILFIIIPMIDSLYRCITFASVLGLSRETEPKYIILYIFYVIQSI